MKIVVVGNLLNFAFLQARELRKRGVHADAIIEKELPVAYHPCHVDREFSSAKYPFVSEFGYGLKSLVFNNELYSKVRGYDLVHITGMGLPWLWNIDLPVVYTAMGADINTVPFYSNPSFGLHVKRNIRAFLMRKSFKKASVIEILPFQDASAERLKLNNLKYFPGAFTDILDDNFDSQFFEIVNNIATNNDYIFLHLSRHYWGVKNRIGKGNDIFIKSLVSLKQTRRKIKVLMVDKGPSVEESKKLLHKLGLEKYVVWFKHLSRSQIRAIYRIPNIIVFDNFDRNVTDIGYVGREALLTGHLLVCNYQDMSRKVYPTPPPVFSINNDPDKLNGIIKILLELSKEEFIEKSKATKIWSNDYISSNAIFNHYINLYRNAL